MTQRAFFSSLTRGSLSYFSTLFFILVVFINSPSLDENYSISKSSKHAVLKGKGIRPHKFVQANRINQDFKVANTPPSEIYFLREFYKNMHGDHWIVSNWNLDGDPCLDAWYGIECNLYNEVISIDLSANNLVGPIPNEIGRRLKSLQKLNLSYNHVTGIIPPTVEYISTLATLNLGHNNMNGPIPSFLGDLPKLTHIDLSYNYFNVGSLPSSVITLSVTHSAYTNFYQYDDVATTW